MEYTIIVCDDNSLHGSQKCRIMQREKLFNKLWILVPQYYNGFDMSECTVIMRYLLPISREFRTETLVLSDEMYKDHLKYTIPIDTNLSKEFGDIELNLTFTMVDTDDEGNIVQRVRKTDNYLLKITPIPDWDAMVVDDSLMALDQRIVKLDAIQKSIKEQNQIMADSKADNLKYDESENSLQLLSGDKEIGDKVKIKAGEISEDGVPVVDFGSLSGGTTPPSEEEDEDVVEF